MQTLYEKAFVVQKELLAYLTYLQFCTVVLLFSRRITCTLQRKSDVYDVFMLLSIYVTVSYLHSQT